MRNGYDRLRALNVPRRVEVELDAVGSPVTVDLATVETVQETWRIDDEWWRMPIVRRYVEVILEGGGRVVLFEDHHPPAAFQNHFDISPDDRHAPPFIIDPPCLLDGFYRRQVDRDRRSDSIELHLHPSRYIEGSKPVIPIPHSALRIPH